jgi:hypothetical protein
MNQGYTSVPFKSEKHSGLSEINGVAKFSSAGIVLEFESKLFGLIANGVKEVRVPLSEILDVEFKKGVFRRGAKIVLRTKTFAALADLPHQDGKVTLKLDKRDFERGSAAVEQLQRELAEIDAQLPPPQTPVSQLFEDESEIDTKPLEK